MRVLLWVVIGLGVLWGGYWFVGARAVERGVAQGFAAATTDGLIAQNTGVAVTGFPSRFDLTVEGVQLADPVTGLGWQAPFVQVLMLSYLPWHVIVALPQDQTFSTPQQTVALRADKLQASVVVQPSLALGLDRIVVAGDALAAQSTLGWTLGAGRLRLATRRIDGPDNTHEVGVQVDDVGLGAGFAGLPSRAESLHLDVMASFTAPLDRHAAVTRPRPTGFDLREGSLRWGDLVVFAKGKVGVDATGRADGRIEVRIEQWRKIIAPAVAAGLIRAEIAATVERALELLATQSGDPETLALPLVFSAGRMSLGPIPLGAAPGLF